MTNSEIIRERVKARQVAVEFLDIAADSTGNMPTDDAREAFWIVLRDEILKHAPQPQPTRPPLVPMSDAQARHFEQQKFPFGRYLDQPICEIAECDPQYIRWLAGNDDSFRRELNRFLASDYVRRMHPDLNGDA